MKRYSFIDVIKFLAVLFVLNSHMDDIYPIPSLATGGAIGNGMFFFASGFLSTNVKDSFSHWYTKRVIRLLPMTSVMALIRLIILDRFQFSTIFIDLIFPTYYWFIAAILVFDIPLYFLVKSNTCISYKNVILFTLGLLYFIYYYSLLDTSKWVVESAGMTSIAGCFKLIYYFGIMLLGATLKLRLQSGESSFSGRKTNHKLLVLSVIFFVAFYGYKIVMNRNAVMMRLQFIQQFLTIAIVLSLAYYLLSAENTFQSHKDSLLMRITTYIGSISLELFLVQEIVVLFAKRLSFPFSFTVMIILTFGGAALLNMLYKMICNRLRKA